MEWHPWTHNTQDWRHLHLDTKERFKERFHVPVSVQHGWLSTSLLPSPEELVVQRPSPANMASICYLLIPAWQHFALCLRWRHWRWEAVNLRWKNWCLQDDGECCHEFKFLFIYTVCYLYCLTCSDQGTAFRSSMGICLLVPKCQIAAHGNEKHRSSTTLWLPLALTSDNGLKVC